MSYTCPRRDCDGFATDDPGEMRAHTAAHGPATIDPRLRSRVRLTVSIMLASALTAPVMVITAVMVLLVFLSFIGWEPAPID